MRYNREWCITNKNKIYIYVYIAFRIAYRNFRRHIKVWNLFFIELYKNATKYYLDFYYFVCKSHTLIGLRRISIAINHIEKQRDEYKKTIKRVSKMLTLMTYNIWESHYLFSQYLFSEEYSLQVQVNHYKLRSRQKNIYKYQSPWNDKIAVTVFKMLNLLLEVLY